VCSFSVTGSFSPFSEVFVIFTINLHSIIIINLLLILSNIPYQGGGDYRGIYDTGLKRGFMGYMGLLLNAPYKIDSMVWMTLMMMVFFLLFLVSFLSNYGAI
jgi:hypothetical protein